MIKVSTAVSEIVNSSEIALSSLANGYMNLSAYAQIILPQVEAKTLKPVKLGSIVVALSRLSQNLNHLNPLEVDVIVEDLTTKSPLVEIAFNKTPQSLASLKDFYNHQVANPSEFLTITQGVDEISIVCSEKIQSDIISIFNTTTKSQIANLVAICIKFSERYIDQPNVIFSLFRKIATKKISVVEIVSTYTELSFIIHQRDLTRALESF